MLIIDESKPVKILMLSDNVKIHSLSKNPILVSSEVDTNKLLLLNWQYCAAPEPKHINAIYTVLKNIANELDVRYMYSNDVLSHAVIGKLNEHVWVPDDMFRLVVPLIKIMPRATNSPLAIKDNGKIKYTESVYGWEIITGEHHTSSIANSEWE